MLGKILKTLVVTLLISLSALAIAPSVLANVQIKVTDLSYESCPEGMGKNLVLGGGIMSANCFLIRGTAVNTSGKHLYNADVFGRVYDANGNDIMPERGRLGAIAEVPPGNTPFAIMLSVPADQQPPLRLEKFKASGFAGKVRR